MVQSDGTGILNYLFAAKNKPHDSPMARNFDQISVAFRWITAGDDFDIFVGKSNALELMFRRNKGVWLAADDCGLGFRDLLIMLYFSVASDKDVVLIEEPENHQHPEIQRKLISFLKDGTDKQFSFLPIQAYS